MPEDGRCAQCGQPLPKSEEWKRRQFRWGITLAAATFVPMFVLGFINMYQAISTARTTGLGAVAGGFSESVMTIGILALLASSIGGIILLVRGYSSRSAMRAMMSVLGIVWFGYLLMCVAGIALMIFTSRLHG